MVSKNAKKGQLSHEYAENPVWDELTSGQTSKPTLWSNKLFPDARPALAPPPQNWTHPIEYVLIIKSLCQSFLLPRFLNM